eukprot:6492161-Heterocapsa_arctica.AAC.1
MPMDYMRMATVVAARLRGKKQWSMVSVVVDAEWPEEDEEEEEEKEEEGRDEKEVEGKRETREEREETERGRRKSLRILWADDTDVGDVGKAAYRQAQEEANAKQRRRAGTEAEE